MTEKQASGPRSFRAKVLGPLLLILIVLVIARPFVTEKIENPSPAIGKAAPQIELVRLSDELSFKPFVLPDTKRVTLIHFWGSWCLPCRVEYPELLREIASFRVTDEFEFLSVSCETEEGESLETTWGDTREFFESNQILDFTSYADPDRATRRSVLQRLESEIFLYPTSMLINHEGKIIGVWEGYLPDSVKEIRARIEDAIEAIP